ncbi:glycosyltransferase [Algoriphagus zhangzhouensis]|uniref:Glycosyltransferase involved in cell wall bisynthesis n=1 Tax=Algoriphagus zhangzhouensis TaxID=1073327 RepID=A0A1M7ZKG9_9BACT|nr:glycosyltransferase [Algoriphagus zhangzhouensis]TDY42881.1 glycosyltransferase involved in cell wall biosynthesis [Algoriphagus zhangzhouensis]SHO65394.1 Glycosyltransferase involved in cell wall bisynthesis [Algoriphagus zhangzhouensis]
MEKEKSISIDISIVLLTYNQEKFVSKAINSILNQELSNSFEIIVIDDFSADDTFSLISEFQDKYPLNFKAYRNAFNLGLAKNYEKAVLLAKGKYIAYLEGDDYWTDPYKLQKQFNFLEENPDLVLAFHDFITIDSNEGIISDKNLKIDSLKKNRSKKDMVTGCLIHQNTIMFRNVVRRFPIGFFKAKNHDTFFIAYLSNWGEAGYVKCSPLHYRIHTNSLWSSLSGKRKHWNGLITYSVILFYVPFRYSRNLIWKIASKVKAIIIS